MRCKSLLVGFAALFILALTACTSQAVTLLTPTPLSENLPLIVDTDMNEDDMRAILYLLKHPNVKVEAITVVGSGEVHCDAGVKHALGLVALNKATDIPVSCGRGVPLEGHHEFPSEWRRDADILYGLSLPEGQAASSLNAPELLAATILDSAEKISIVAIGPLTNIAQALLANPEIVNNISMIYIMGGAVETPGNVGPSGVGIDNQVAEWNIYIDPHAANVVFNSGAPLTLIPIDATQDAPVTMRFYNALKDQHASPEAAFAYDMMTTRLDVIKSGGLQFWDSLTAAIATDESLAEFETFEIQVVEEEGPESGYTKPTPRGARVKAAVSADGSRFEETFLSILNLP